MDDLGNVFRGRVLAVKKTSSKRGIFVPYCTTYLDGKEARTRSCMPRACCNVPWSFFQLRMRWCLLRYSSLAGSRTCRRCVKDARSNFFRGFYSTGSRVGYSRRTCSMSSGNVRIAVLSGLRMVAVGSEGDRAACPQPAKASQLTNASGSHPLF